MVIARGTITLHHVVDITSTTWYYKLQASTASAPAKPTTQTPSGWSTTEPAYTEGSTNSLYIVQKTTFSDGTFDYSDVSLSSSYEAAKVAYNKSVQALDAVTPIDTKTYTGLIGSANDAANASFYFAKVHPKNYTVQWNVSLRFHVTSPEAYAQDVTIRFGGYGSNFSSFDAYTVRTSSVGMYFVNLYRATRVGIETNKKGHALGIGLRASTNPTDANYARTITVELLETENCTVDMFNTAVKYASIDGTGSTNYYSLTEMSVSTAGQNATNNSNTSYQQHGTAVKAGANGVRSYSLIMKDTDSTWSSLFGSAYNGTATGKTACTNGFHLGSILYSAGAPSGGNYAAGANTSTVYDGYPLDFRYSSNCASTLVLYRPVYLVGEMHDDGLFYLDETWWTQTVPTAEDGKTYVYVGEAYSSYQVWLSVENPAYQYYEGKFRKLSEVEEMKAAKTATNYIYDSQALGLIVAREAPASDSDVSTIGWHTRQTADGFDVYYNSTRVAHYGDEVWIGAGGRKIKISDNGYRIDRGNTNLMYAGLSEANVLITKSEKWWTARNDTIYSSIYDSGETITMGSTIASWAVQAIKNVYLSGKPDTPPICLVRGENYTVGSDKSITLKAADTEDADDPMMLYLQDVPDRFGDTSEYHFTASFVVEYTTAAQADYFQFGENSENNGLDALAQGIGCEAGGSYSAAQGDHVKASNVGETAVGRYNESGPDVMFNVGCGTNDNNRKSALMVYGDGKTRVRQILAEDIVAETGAIDALQASSIYGTGGTLTIPTKLEVLKSSTSTVTKAGSVTIQDINSIVGKSGWARLQYSFKANAAIAAWTTIGTTDVFNRPAADVRCFSNGRFWQITTAGNIQPTSALTSGETYIVEAVYPIKDYTT